MFTRSALIETSPCMLFSSLIQRWKVFKLRRKEGNTTAADCKKAIQSVLKFNPTRLPLFRV